MNCIEDILPVAIPTSAGIENAPGRLLRAKGAMKFLGMSRPTFHRHIKKGIAPKQHSMGTTPHWRLGDLQKIYNELSDVPVFK